MKILEIFELEAGEDPRSDPFLVDIRAAPSFNPNTPDAAPPPISCFHCTPARGRRKGWERADERWIWEEETVRHINVAAVWCSDTLRNTQVHAGACMSRIPRTSRVSDSKRHSVKGRVTERNGLATEYPSLLAGVEFSGHDGLPKDEEDDCATFVREW